MQTQYDLLTNHSFDTAEQKKWDDRIEAMLKDLEKFAEYRSEEVKSESETGKGENLKQTVQHRVNFPDHFSKVLIVLRKFILIDIDHQQWSFAIAFNPFIIKIIQTLKVIEADIFFIIPSSFLNLRNKRGHRSL